jgi:outer membrane receptor protein involved in Fe transport
MRIRSLSIAVLLATQGSGAVEARANEPLIVAQAEPSSAAAGDAGQPADEPEEETDAKTAPAPSRPGIEEIVIKGGESEAAADYQAADSVTAFDASDLEALGAQTIEDLASYTPNLEIVTAGATTPTFFIRGVGLNDFNANSTGAVAIYQDDVAINAPALQLGTLFDMEAVNILRGPQGTGLFRNASAGAIKLYTRKPSGEFDSYLRSSYGNYDYMDFEGAIEAPLYSEILSSRLAFRFTQRDGYGENGCAASTVGPFGTRCGEDPGNASGPVPPGLPEEVNNLHNWAARGTFRIQPTLDMDWLLGIHGARRNEDSRLGQSIGTSGTICLNNDIENCFGRTPNGSLSAERILYPFGSASQNVFGNSDSGPYQDPDITRMVRSISVPLRQACASLPTANNERAICQRRADNTALMQVSEDLVDLDDDPYRGDYNRVGPTKNDTWGGYLNGEIALPYGLTLSTVSGYDGYDRFIDVDLDQSPNTLFEIVTEDQGWQATQDVRLAGGFAELPLRWEVGGYMLREHIDVQVENFLPSEVGTVGLRDYTQDIWSAAGYTSLEWDIDERFTLDGGFRWNYERKWLDFFLRRTGVPYQLYPEDEWQAPTGLVRLTYRFREDTHSYWKYTRGWKPGHFNATASGFQPILPAKPETIDAFETGLRGSWFEGRLGLDLSIFYYSYDDYQLFTVKVDSGESPEFVVINASNAEVYGSEIDLVARPFPGTFLNVRGSWLDSRFNDFTQQQFVQQQAGDALSSDNILKEIDSTGNRLLNSPRFKLSLTAEQTIPLGRYGSITARYDGAWTDDTYFDATEGQGIVNQQGLLWMPENAIAQPAYWLHNIWVGYRPPAGNIEIGGWVRNLTDEVYRTFAFDASNFSQTTIHLLGTPRTYGLTVNVGF